MDYLEAIEQINELLENESYLDEYSGASNQPMNVALDVAIKSLEMQEKIHEAISEIDRKYDNYDVMLIIEVKDILNELIID